MSTIKSLAAEFKCSEDKVLDIAETKLGFIPLTISHEIPGTIEKQLVKQLEAVTGIVRKDKETKQLLSSDCVILTLTAMEKPGMCEILRQMLEKGMPDITGRIVVLKEAFTVLEQDANAEKDVVRAAFLKKNLDILRWLKDNQHLVVLDGAIAEEGVTLGRYIRDNRKPETTVLVLGKNMSLDTFVYIMNEAYVVKSVKGDKTIWAKNPEFTHEKGTLFAWRQYSFRDNYIPVEQCSFSARGYLFKVDEVPIFGPDIDEKFKYFKPKGESKKEKYTIDLQITEIQETPIDIPDGIPGEGASAYVFRDSVWTPVPLKSMIHKGGTEGGIYALEDPSLCAKILKPESITERKMKKLEILCKGYRDIDGGLIGRDNSVIRRISWPQEMLYASQNTSQPIGYIMRKLDGTIGMDNMKSKVYRKFVNDEKEKQIIAAISLTELVRFLHENNIILCDINTGNIMFDDNQRAYLVDLDSAQVTDPKPILDDKNKIAHYTCYPANVATPQFLSPEHIDDTSYSFVHSIKDDVWSLQYMIFLLLTMSGSYLPFQNSQSTPEGRTDIKEGRYLYPKYYNASQSIEADDLLYKMHCIMSRLPQELRSAFYNAFSGQGSRFAAKDRCDAKVWMRWLINYYESLPARIEQDTENGKYMPSSVYYGRDQMKINMTNGSDAYIRILNNLLNQGN